MGPEKGYANKYSKTYLGKVTIARKVVRQQEIALFYECVRGKYLITIRKERGKKVVMINTSRETYVSKANS